MTTSGPSGQPAPSRRALLAGTAGVVGLAIGAGATEAANALTRSSGPDTGPHVASPGEELMVEHGVLKRVLLAYRAIGDRLAAGDTPPVGAVADAANIVSSFIESFHEGLEEAYVFPRVRADHPDLIETLLVQHDKGRHLTRTITQLAADGLTTAKSRSQLALAVAAFVRMYEPHEAWEDTVVFPALRSSSTQRTLDLLAERFAELENRQFGDAALTTVLDRVTGVEQQLGIADLSHFTP